NKEGKHAEAVTVESSYSDISGKKILLVDDVITSGERIRLISELAKEINATIVGTVILIDKKGIEVIGDIPVRCLIRIVPLQK
ncbi:MAG: phosphoribosyltransferase family protein, partial [Candidatus Odinarchaeia archaeon]